MDNIQIEHIYLKWLLKTDFIMNSFNYYKLSFTNLTALSIVQKGEPLKKAWINSAQQTHWIIFHMYI